MKAVVDTRTGNKSGRCGGGSIATHRMLKTAIRAMLM